MTSNPFQSSGPQLVVSILSADFARLGEEMADAMRAGGDFFQTDIMDGHFVPNISFGPPVIERIRPVTQAYIDAHLMISEPVRYAPAMVKAGANNITFHVEAVADPAAAAREIRRLGCNVGIALNPETPAERIWPALEHVDLVLVMSVHPGFGGQSFMREVLPKASAIRKRLGPAQHLEIDGGINIDTIGQAANAGVDWFVVGSAIFDKKDRRAAVEELRARIGG